MNLPTPETYDELQRAYDFFNEKLFSNELPPCLITLQREKRTYGYCSFKRFVGRESGYTVDEIAMNPVYFSIRTTAAWRLQIENRPGSSCCCRTPRRICML
ncbi:hypothetical protein L468_05524 [Klebsiella pneumoniae BIDMC 32]|nr:hypothetical protein L468_05524 [Klebsiella pneumoniae BIDMC 32]